MRTTPLALLLLMFCTLPWLPMTSNLAASAPPALPDKLLRDATLVLRRALDTPSAAIPASVMRRASGIAVFPAARIDGSMYYGMGVMSARGADPLRWTPPAILTFQGAIPIHLEATTVDFVIVAMTRRGLDYLTQDEMLPVLTRIHPGQLGQDGPEALDADLFGYMEFGDYFAGVSVENWTVVGMRSSNQQLYRHPYSTYDIVSGAGFFNPPQAARAWLDTLSSYFREMS
jgi:lipid-binding SYLF domain-containing protein